MASLEHKYGFKLSRPRFESYREKEETAVIAKLEAKAQPCIGATQVLEELQRVQKYGLAVVSSSALPRVRACIKKAGQDRYFREDHIFSAATSLKKPTSKPDPAVYLHACKVCFQSPQLAYVAMLFLHFMPGLGLVTYCAARLSEPPQKNASQSRTVSQGQPLLSVPAFHALHMSAALVVQRNRTR